MANTVAVISKSGFLADTFGRNKESDSRYLKFSRRILGADTDTAVLDYGWNGALKMRVSSNGLRGQSINLDADTVLVPSELRIGGENIRDIIDSCTDLAISGIAGTDHEINVSITSNDDSSASSSQLSRLSCKISLSPEMLDRINTIEYTLDDLFRFDEAYKVGDGLEVIRSDKNRLRVKLGEGLKFRNTESSESYDLYDDDDDDSVSAPIELDYDTYPTAGSRKPVTSDGILRAISSGITGQYSVGVDPSTGNITLYRND